jgi:hypothetical protein
MGCSSLKLKRQPQTVAASSKKAQIGITCGCDKMRGEGTNRPSPLPPEMNGVNRRQSFVSSSTETNSGLDRRVTVQITRLLSPFFTIDKFAPLNFSTLFHTQCSLFVLVLFLLCVVVGQFCISRLTRNIAFSDG